MNSAIDILNAKEGASPYVVIVGGVNMDICGRSFGELIAQDSNPGNVRMSLGGVGRNIAHNLSLLGVKVHLLTAFGDDMAAEKIASSCGELGIDISNALKIPGESTSTYLYISGPDGNMELAIADMEIYNHITPDFLASKAKLLDSARLVIIDTNIPAESILWLAENCKADIFADPVSTTKAKKLRPALGKLHTLKPNCIEAEFLSGEKINDLSGVRRAAEALLSTGMKEVFISMGGDGVYAADSERQVHVPCIPGNMVNTTGCGDSFMAAIAWAHLNGADIFEKAKAGLAASSITMESAETINTMMGEAEVRRRMQRSFVKD